MTRRVLQVGPPASSMGGMAEVASLLASADATLARGYSAPMLDSGGGRGRRGYIAFPGAVRRVALGSYDLLHLHVASGGSVIRKAALAEAARARRKPYVVHLHGGGFQRFLANGSRQQLFVARRLFTGAARVVVLGSRWVDVVRELGVPLERIAMVPNGVAPLVESVRPFAERSREVAFVGGITRAKGIDVLLDVLEAHGGDPDWSGWRFVLIGPQSEADLAARISGLEAMHPGLIECPGPLFGEAKAQRMASAAVFALPSRAEGLPLVVLEAMACGVPPVATDVGSTHEVVTDGEDGLLVPPGDATALAHALRTVIADEVLRRRLGESARHTWEESYSAEVMALRMTEVWEEALIH